MHIQYTYDTIPDDFRCSVLALGNFDGVHLGHRAVLTLAQDLARRAGQKAGVLTFDPHPKQFFNPETLFFELTSVSRKLKLFEALDLDLAVILKFNEGLAEFSADEFVEHVLVRGLKVSHVVTGYNFYFGKDRQGSPDYLKHLGAVHNFAVSIVPQQKKDNAAYSSTHIRDLLRAGQVLDAARALGYWWRVEGVVQGGAKRGTGLGFPTANIALKEGQHLKHGIYAVHIYTAQTPYKGQTQYKGAAYLGARPTFDNGAVVLEVFLFDFDDNLYGQQIEVEFIAYLREDQKFANEEELKAQMTRDCQQARDILGGAVHAEQNILSL